MNSLRKFPLDLDPGIVGLSTDPPSLSSSTEQIPPLVEADRGNTLRMADTGHYKRTQSGPESGRHPLKSTE